MYFIVIVLARESRHSLPTRQRAAYRHLARSADHAVTMVTSCASSAAKLDFDFLGALIRMISKNDCNYILHACTECFKCVAFNFNNIFFD